MEIIKEEYEGHSEEEGGYFQNPGAVFRFIENDKEYKFDVEVNSKYANNLGAIINGNETKIMVNTPYGNNKKVIQIPTHCIVFKNAISELKLMGIKHISFYNQVSGGYKEFSINELQNA